MNKKLLVGLIALLIPVVAVATVTYLGQTDTLICPSSGYTSCNVKYIVDGSEIGNYTLSPGQTFKAVLYGTPVTTTTTTTSTTTSVTTTIPNCWAKINSLQCTRLPNGKWNITVNASWIGHKNSLNCTYGHGCHHEKMIPDHAHIVIDCDIGAPRYEEPSFTRTKIFRPWRKKDLRARVIVHDYFNNVVCETPIMKCPNLSKPGEWDYCKVYGPCSAGQGDCDSDSECQPGLHCVQNVGANYGWNRYVDVCE